MSRWIEQSFGDDAVVMFSHSASGDVNPKHHRTGTNSLASIASAPITGYEFAQEPLEEPIRDFFVPLVRADSSYVRQMFTEVTATGIMVAEQVIRLMSSISEWDSSPKIWS